MLNRIEVFLIILTLVLLPWSWSLSLYALALLFLNMAAKCITTRRMGNPVLDRSARMPFYAMTAFVVWYAVSLLWTDNLSEGYEMAATKGSMALASIIFLCSDMRHITRRQLRLILYLASLSLVCLFLVRLGINIRRVITEPETTWVSRMTFGFDKRHHSYISFYIIVALWGLCYEQIHSWHQMSSWCRCGIVALVVLLSAYLVVINSRAGVLFLLISLFLMAGYVIYLRRRWFKPVVSLLCALSVAVGVHYALPKTQNRVQQTSLTSAAASQGTTEQASRKDKRLPIWQASLRLASDNWLLGVGVGDRFDSLVPLFNELGDQESIDRRKNCHCQPLDTLVSVGIIGLIVLLSLFVSLIVASVRQRNWLLFVFTLCLGFNCLFETLFDRQMALFFVPIVVGLLSMKNSVK